MARNKPKKKDKSEKYLSEISKGVKDMVFVDHMAEETVVPTKLTGYNRAMGIGGHPLGCFSLIHGPNQVGKSVLAMAIAESLRQAGFPSYIFDSEYAGEKEWYSAITPRSKYMRIANLDLLISNIQIMLTNLRKGKERKENPIPKEVGCVFIVDTLTKLMPKEILEKLEKEGPSKAYPIQAMWISLWSKSIIPQLADSNSTMLVVTQERQNISKAGPWEDDYKASGGKSIQYDNRVRLRVSSSKRVKSGDKVVGMQCRYSVENNKIVGTSYSKASFFTSNGEGDMPKGLDHVREAIEEAREHREGIFVKKTVTNKKTDKKKNIIEARFDGEALFKVDGGWEDVRRALIEQPELFESFVEKLNAEVLNENRGD